MQLAVIERAGEIFKRREALLKELADIHAELERMFGSGSNGHQRHEEEPAATQAHPLHLWLDKHNMTQSGLAEKLKCSVATIGFWINGKTRPAGTLREKLQELLGRQEFERMERLPHTKQLQSTRS